MVRAYAEASVSMDDAETKGVKKIDCLRVNEQLRVCGDALIDGVLTLASQPVISLAIGTPGVPGIGGDLAFSAAANIGTGTLLVTVTSGGIVPFNVNVITEPALVPSAGGVTSNGTSITVANAGIYRIQAQLAGIGADPADPLAFQLQINGAPFAAGLFVGNTSSANQAGSINTVSGFGIISLPAGAVLTLVNVSDESVNLVSAVGVVNTVFTVERIA